MMTLATKKRAARAPPDAQRLPLLCGARLPLRVDDHCALWREWRGQDQSARSAVAVLARPRAAPRGTRRMRETRRRRRFRRLDRSRSRRRDDAARPRADAVRRAAFSHRPRAGVFGAGLRRSRAGALAHAGDGRAFLGRGGRKTALSGSAGARRRRRARRARQQAGAGAAQPKPAPRRRRRRPALARRRRAGDRRARRRRGRRAARDRFAARRADRRRTRRRLALSVGGRDDRGRVGAAARRASPRSRSRIGIAANSPPPAAATPPPDAR